MNAQAGTIRFFGDQVAVDVKGAHGLDALVQAAAQDGMSVGATDPRTVRAEGFVPIDRLVALASSDQVVGLTPSYRPIAGQEGIANNQADQVFGSEAARSRFDVDGTGVKVDILSDSFNSYQGGYADSLRTGDLPAGVLDLQDVPGGEDEGRAMLELVHDIAPGAGLAFNTAFGGQMGFAQGIRNLAGPAFGAVVIADDVYDAGEPYFQYGDISQAIADVTNQTVLSVT